VRRVAAGAFAVVMAVALSACGLARIGYRNGDTVGVFWMNRYLDLSSEQKDFVKPRLHGLLVWHRTTQLPDYAAFAQDLQKKTAIQVTAADVAALGEAARRRAMTTVYHALPDLADLALQLTPDNVDAMQEKFAKDDDKWRDEFMKGDLERQKKARYEKSLERAEEWYGRFSSEQRERIRGYSDARPLRVDILLDERQRRERELVALLARVVREKPSRDVVIASLKSYADRFDHNPDPEHARVLDAWRHATEAMDAEIHNLSTPEQRKRVVARLQDWIDDFRDLSSSAQ
jgi:hypothetical protein